MARYAPGVLTGCADACGYHPLSSYPQQRCVGNDGHRAAGSWAVQRGLVIGHKRKITGMFMVCCQLLQVLFRLAANFFWQVNWLAAYLHMVGSAKPAAEAGFWPRRREGMAPHRSAVCYLRYIDIALSIKKAPPAGRLSRRTREIAKILSVLKHKNHLLILTVHKGFYGYRCVGESPHVGMTMKII